MKKSLVLFLALFLTSCTNKYNVDPIKTTEISVWVPAKEEKVIREIIDDWNKSQNDNYDFNVKIRKIASSETMSIISKNPTSQDNPTLFLGDAADLYKFKNKDIIASIPVEEKNKLKNNFSSKTLESVTINNEYYGYPFSINNSYHLFYNNKFINDQEATSLEAILSKAKELKKQVYLDVANGYFISSFFLSPQACGLNSISYRYDEKGNAIYTSNWDNEEGVKISSYLSKLFNSYYLDGTISLPGGESLVTFIKDESVIASFSNYGYFNSIDKVCDTASFTVLPKYHIEGKEYQIAAYNYTSAYFVNKNKSEEEQKTARALAELLTSKEASLYRYETNGEIPLNAKAREDERFLEKTNDGELAEIRQYELASVNQELSVEDKFWDVGREIGQAYLNSEYLKEKSWKEFLKEKMDELRNPLK